VTKTAPSHFREPGKPASGRRCSDNEDSSPQVRTLDQAIFTVTGHLPSVLHAVAVCSFGLAMPWAAVLAFV
jgi:hypothetical protein